MDWVEVEAKSVELAVVEGMKELGITDREYADVEVLQEPETGLLSMIGLGGKPARVIVKKKTGKRRNRNRSRSRSKEDAGNHNGKRRDQGPQTERQSSDRVSSKPKDRDQKPNQSRGKSERSDQSGSKCEGRGRNQPAGSRGSQRDVGPKNEAAQSENKEIIVTNEEQAEVVKAFLEGLLGAFGLEGSVTSTVEDGTIIADIHGDQTEALVGPKGSIMHAINELTRTVVQRRTHESVRLRLDIAGFGAQRREALAIYAQRLAEQVKDEGAEIMLEPMNAGDRKVIHDAVSDIEGVASYSEGDEPRRSVVLAPAE